MASSPYELVRVEDPSTGHQYTVARLVAEREGLVLLDKQATDSRGRALRALPRTNKAREAAPRPNPQPETTEKES